MADKQGVASLGPYILRVQSGKLFTPNDVASDINNFFATPEGTLRAVTGPAGLVLNDGVLPRAFTGDGTSPSGTIKYGSRMHGIYHASLLNNQRDVLLLHTNDEIWEFTGWDRCWRKLVASVKPTYGVRADLVDSTQPQFPTQFESTSNGVVIVPQDQRAFFYDGVTIAPLGFSRKPGPPVGRGPSSSKHRSSQHGAGINDIGYAHDGTPYDDERNLYEVGMESGFGVCRVGTSSNLTFDSAVFGTSDSPANAGWLLNGEYRCKTQYIDKWGNLSAMSAPSDGVRFQFQPSKIPAPGTGTSVAYGSDQMLKQIAWTNISLGPEHCIGRVLYRTKDMVNSGTQDYFRHTQNAAGVASDFATLPDNITQIYPDNIPDAFLITKAEEIDPVPNFKLCRMAFGRLWIGNMADTPGMIKPSMPGRFGTFPSNQELYPDPTGGEITGMWRANRGLLVFTRAGTFVVEPSDDGARFKSSVLSSQVGCEAPSSIATLDDGRTIWLAKDGFYTYDGASIKFISEELREIFKQVTPSRRVQANAVYDPKTKEYRCWVSTNGNVDNDTCFVYDGRGWRRRTDFTARSVCVTQDHRSYLIGAGYNGVRTGAFVLDTPSSDTASKQANNLREASIETAWMQSQQSLNKNTTRKIYLWLRETANSDITIDVYRDWRSPVTETVTTKRYAGDDVPKFYESTKLGSGATFHSRRPFWTRASVYVPSNDTFKFKISGTGDWEFIGLQVDVAPRAYGGAMVPP